MKLIGCCEISGSHGDEYKDDSIERRGPVVNIPASYTGGPFFRSQSGDRLS
jgi:hypothetical protein